MIRLVWLSGCARFQLSILSRSGSKVCGSEWCGLALSTISNLNPSCIELELGLEVDNLYNMIQY